MATGIPFLKPWLCLDLEKAPLGKAVIEPRSAALEADTASLAKWLRRPPRERKIPGSNPSCDRIFPGSSHTCDLKKLTLQWLPCQAPGVIGSVLGLVGLASVYCDWVRWKVWSATSISVWQHVQLSEQIRPWDTFACCWDVKQPTNKQTRGGRFTTRPLRRSHGPASVVLCVRTAVVLSPRVWFLWLPTHVRLSAAGSVARMSPHCRNFRAETQKFLLTQRKAISLLFTPLEVSSQ